MSTKFFAKTASSPIRRPQPMKVPAVRPWAMGPGKDPKSYLQICSSIVAGFLFLSLGLAFLIGLANTPAALAGNQESRIIRIVDGDTLSVEYNGRKENIRLIGIDTPESRVNKKAKKDAARSHEDIAAITKMGKEATRFVKTLVKPGDPVAIEFDRQPRDKYGRLLGYVYLSDGKMLNEEIVKAGYASLMTYPPNVKYQDRFLRAYREARENSRGLWSRQ
jgi:micrococcal nuclease